MRDMEQHQAPSGTDSDEDVGHYHSLEPHDGAATHQATDQQHEARVPKAPAPPMLPSPSGIGHHEEEEEGTASADLYHKHRREALKLSRSWRKKLHRAANAFAAGQHSGTPLVVVAHCMYCH